MAVAISAGVASLFVSREQEQRLKRSLLQAASLLEDHDRVPRTFVLRVVCFAYDALVGKDAGSRQSWLRILVAGIALVGTGCVLAGPMTETLFGFRTPPWHLLRETASKNFHRTLDRNQSTLDQTDDNAVTSDEKSREQREYQEWYDELTERLGTPEWGVVHTIALAALVLVVIAVPFRSSVFFTRRLLVESIAAERADALTKCALLFNVVISSVGGLVTVIVIVYAAIIPIVFVTLLPAVPRLVWATFTNYWGAALAGFFIIIGWFAAEPWMRVVALVAMFPAWFAAAGVLILSLAASVLYRPIKVLSVPILRRVAERRSAVFVTLASYSFLAATFLGLFMQFAQGLTTFMTTIRTLASQVSS